VLEVLGRNADGAGPVFQRLPWSDASRQEAGSPSCAGFEPISQDWDDMGAR